MDRRTFLAAGLMAGAAVRSKSAHSADQQLTEAGGELDLSTIPNFCGHEHWGSLSSLGWYKIGFRCDVFAGALPQRETTLMDLIVDPYLKWWIDDTGAKLDELAKKATGISDFYESAVKKPVETLRAVRPVLRNHQFGGAYQTNRRGILLAYGFDINSDDAAGIQKANKAVSKNYRDIFGWYKRLMAKAHLSELIRPVHPEFYVQEETPQSARQELSFTHTIMRIDPFLELHKARNSRRRGLAKIAGVEPHDAKTWRQFLDNIFELAAKKGTTGIKQMQAYNRPLKFEPRKDSEVKFTGELSGDETLVFQDWVMHECCKRAHDRNWPHQVHVGTHNLPDSNPLPLQHLAKRYPKQKIVMLHCWPYQKECGHLAKHFANIYIDTCWQPVLNPQFLRQSLELWLGYVPISKIMLGHDSTTVEMAVGSSLFTREILAEALTRAGKAAGLGKKELCQMAADFLQNNAVDVYRIGERFAV